MYADTDSVMGAYTVYIGGAMQGHPEFNFPMFDDVRDVCVDVCHWRVISPADQDRQIIINNLGPLARAEDLPGYYEGDWKAYGEAAGFTYDGLLGLDFVRIIQECQGCVFLPGWEKSVGATSERFVAERTNKDIWLANPVDDMWLIASDPVPKRMVLTVRPVFGALDAVH